MKGFKCAVSFALMCLFTASALADVGVIIEFPDGHSIAKCVRISDGYNPYQILNELSLQTKWSDDGSFGRALCMVEGIGSEPNGQSCSDWSSYWAFSLSLDGGASWTAHSPVGSTGGDCWNRDYKTPSYDGHYCSKDGDILGYHYTGDFPSGYPTFISFEDLCDQEKDSHVVEKKIIKSSRPFWENFAKVCGIEYVETVPPQSLAQKCYEKRRRAGIPLTGTRTSEESKIVPQFEYNPGVVKYGSAFEIRFFTEEGPLEGLKVLINGKRQITDSLGRVFMIVSERDFKIVVDEPEYLFEKTFRFE